jgi:hypothetical protein
MRAAAGLCLVGLAAGCGDPSYQDGNLRCAVSASACPSGFHCAADDTCWRDGHDPDLASAGDLAQPDLAGVDLAGADFAVPPDLVSTADLTADDSGCLPLNPVACCGDFVDDCGHSMHCTNACPNQVCGGSGFPHYCGCPSGSRSAVYGLTMGSLHCYSAQVSPGNPVDECMGYTIDGTTAKFFVYIGDPPVGLTLLSRCIAAGHYFLATDAATCDGVSGATLDGTLGYFSTAAACGAVPLHRYDTGANGFVYSTNAADKPAGSTEVMPPFYVWTN